jgi:hypothetical protein
MDHAPIEQLAALANAAPSADNSQPATMRWDGSTLAIAYAPRHPATNVFGADSHATLLAVGGLIENLQRTLDANAVATQWRFGAPGEQPYATLTPGALPATLKAPAGLLERHTDRLAYRRGALPADLLARVGAAREGAAAVTALTSAGDIATVARMVRQCSEARFCNEQLHRWLFGSLRATPTEVAAGDGLDMRTLGLPPGGKTLMKLISDWPRLQRLNGIGLYKMLALAEIKLIAKAPAVLCLTGAPGRAGTLDAGRLLTRVWSELNLAGVAVQPFYVVTDQLNRLAEGTLAAGFDARVAAVETDMRRLLALGEGQQLHMMLRIGYPAGTPVRSRRLPLAGVFADTSR